MKRMTDNNQTVSSTLSLKFCHSGCEISGIGTLEILYYPKREITLGAVNKQQITKTKNKKQTNKQTNKQKKTPPKNKQTPPPKKKKRKEKRNQFKQVTNFSRHRMLDTVETHREKK